MDAEPQRLADVKPDPERESNADGIAVFIQQPSWDCVSIPDAKLDSDSDAFSSRDV
jgi:hypothetical protein